MTISLDYWYSHMVFYSKGDYDGAIDQYIRTIGQLEPSYVIRKVHLHDPTGRSHLLTNHLF